MNDNILLSSQKKTIIYEILERYWVRSPIKIKLGPSCIFAPTCSYIHNDIEFNYIIEGDMSICLDGREHRVKAGDVFCVNQYVAHSMMVTENVKYLHLIISTRYLLEHGIDPSKLWFDDVIRDDRGSSIFEEIIEVYNSKLLYKRAVLIANVLRFIGFAVDGHAEIMPEGITSKLLHPLGKDFDYVKKSVDFITDNFEKPLTLDEISTEVGISKFYLTRLFKRYTDLTVIDYLNNIRCEHAKALLTAENANVTAVAFACGFNNSSYFAKIFKKYVKKLPSDYIAKQKKENS